MSATEAPKAGTFILLRVEDATEANAVLDALHAQGVDAPIVGAYDTAFGVQGVHSIATRGLMRMTRLQEDFYLLTQNGTEVVAGVSAANIGLVLLNTWAPQGN